MKNLCFLLLLMGSLTIVSCGTDDDHDHMDGDYDATIVINSPTEGAEVTIGEAAHIDVVITRPDSKIIHNVKIEVQDADGAVLATLIDAHAHEEGEYKYHENSFTPESHGAHKLVVTTTNDAGEHAVTKEVNFTAVHGAGTGEYKVTIEILKPSENAIVALNSDVEVEVNYTHDTHGERIHNVLIDVVDANGDQVAKIFEEHVHSDMPYSFANAAAWKAETLGNYTLRAMTTDFDGMNMNMVMREFSVE